MTPAPASNIFSPGSPTAPTSSPSATFTGTVFLSPFGAAAPALVAQVTFSPGARTFWHTHAGGQHIAVTQGKGWICDLGGEPRRIKAGDVIFCQPGVTHWHGGDAGSIMSHTVMSLGETTWGKEVGAEEYARAKET